MKRTEIHCDFCGELLNLDTSYPHKFGLHLETKDYAVNTSGMQYALAMYPPLETPLDFCGWKCLSNWVSTKSPLANDEVSHGDSEKRS
jgi:hypothetical protein